MNEIGDFTMSNVVTVKNVRIGEGIPKICVPIVGKHKDDILSEANNLRELHVDILEWRVDYFEGAKDLIEIQNVLEDMRKCLPNMPILFTFRTSLEGGEKEIETKEYIKLNQEVIKTGFIDLVDVELFRGDEVVKEIVSLAHLNGVKVIASNHDFHTTPAKEEMISRLNKMKELGADLLKIAVMPNSKKDVLELLSTTNEMSEMMKDCPIITMAMGKLGRISRISGEIFGSAVTFGAVKKASAPGQIAVEDLYSILHILHE